MAQVFHRAFNTLSKVSIFGAVFMLVALAVIGGAVARSAYVTQQHVVRPQPVPFSHQHHVAGLGIDCRYCHTSVEDSAFAGIPPTRTCMNCHAFIWSDAPMLAPVRDSVRTGESLPWTRVHDLPDFVYFDHSIHVKKGVGCVTCHGRLDEMPLTWREVSLHMEWCLSCHRNPQPYLRPPSEVFNMEWQPPNGRPQVFEEEHSAGGGQLTNCSICHR
ncbi:MAG TPA: cytochrome c3 family protein [Phycisphaerae bacterium]